jgi:hypothetical protein
MFRFSSASCRSEECARASACALAAASASRWA